MKVLNFKQSYFELFELEINFDIDLTALRQKQQALQAKFHPDNFVNAKDTEKRLSVQQASWVNEAYRVLANHVTRAQYMLKLNGYDNNDDSATTSDITFLMEQIELREEMESIRSTDDPLEKCEGIIKNLKIRAHEFSTEFVQNYTAGDFSAARLVSQKMLFIQKIQDQVRDLQFELEDELI